MYPNWLQTLLNAFLKSIKWTSLQTPIDQTFAYRCQEHDDRWRVIVSPWLHEIYGGRNDGSTKIPAYEVNVLPITNQFDKIHYLGFDADRLEARIEGEIDNDWVTFVLRRLPPKGSRIRKQINTFTGEVTKIIKQ